MSSTFATMGKRDDVLRSTAECQAGSLPIYDFSVIARLTNEPESTESTTASETTQVTLSRWYDEHVFEGVEYNPDAVQSLALADICPEDFLSADDIQLDDSGFWTSSCDITPESTSNSSVTSRRTSEDDDASPCFSNLSDEQRSDIFSDWVDNFAEECYASPDCEPHGVTLDSVRAKSPGAISVSVTSPEVVMQCPPDVSTLPTYSCYPNMQKRGEPPIVDAATRGVGRYLETVPVNESSQHATSTDVQFDVQTLTELDDTQDCCSIMPTSSDKKPTMAYMTMIAMAILSTPQKRSLLNDIYESIIQTFPYYKHSKSAWRNSVRHNLSVNECFVKSGRAPSGRGFYWAIHPACLDDFKRGDFNRRQARSRAQTNYRLLEDYRQRAQVACSSSHAAAQPGYYVHMRSTPTGHTDQWDNHPAQQQQHNEEGQQFYYPSKYWF